MSHESSVAFDADSGADSSDAGSFAAALSSVAAIVGLVTVVFAADCERRLAKLASRSPITSDAESSFGAGFAASVDDEAIVAAAEVIEATSADPDSKAVNLVSIDSIKATEAVFGGAMVVVDVDATVVDVEEATVLDVDEASVAVFGSKAANLVSIDSIEATEAVFEETTEAVFGGATVVVVVDATVVDGEKATVTVDGEATVVDDEAADFSQLFAAANTISAKMVLFAASLVSAAAIMVSAASNLVSIVLTNFSCSLSSLHGID